MSEVSNTNKRTGQRVLTSLRRMISSGELAAGERLAEIPIAARLDASRMPVRMAFRELEQEGLLVRVGARGFAVRAVSPTQIAGAVAVRGALEGLAAGLLAERGARPEVLRTLKACLMEGDALLEKGSFTEADAPLYLELNVKFHATIIQASGNEAIAEALARNDHLPFASVKALAIDRNHLDVEYLRLNYAHTQHHVIVEAIEAGQSARAEALMREHANAVLRNTDLDPARQGMKILHAI